MSHRYAKDRDFTQWDRCQCGQLPCHMNHEPPMPHQIAGTAGVMFDPNKLHVMCRCGELAEFDMQWGMMVIPSPMWRRVERELQDNQEATCSSTVAPSQMN